MKVHSILVIFFSLLPTVSNAQWYSHATGFTNPNYILFDLSIPDANTIWGIASDGNQGIGYSAPEFTRSVDGGATFHSGAAPSGYFWSNICAVDSSTAWISAVNMTALSDGIIFNTTDGGATWNEQGVGSIFNATSYANFVYFWDEHEGIAQGNPNPGEFEIYVTHDGGQSWIPIQPSSIPDPLPYENGVWKNFCTYGNHIWFGTSRARIFHSPDRGMTWSVGNTGITIGGMGDYVDLAFWNESEGIIRKFDEGTQINTDVKITQDGGTSWNSISTTGPLFGGFYGGISYVPGTPATLVSVGIWPLSCGSSYSNDGGYTWIPLDTMVMHYATKFYNKITGWSSTYSVDSITDGIFMYSGDPLGIENETENTQTSIFPNPSHGNFTLQITNTIHHNFKITLEDLGGRIVFEKQTKDQIGNEFNFNLEHVSKGMYILKLMNDFLNYSEKIIIQ